MTRVGFPNAQLCLGRESSRRSHECGTSPIWLGRAHEAAKAQGAATLPVTLPSDPRARRAGACPGAACQSLTLLPHMPGAGRRSQSFQALSLLPIVPGSLLLGFCRVQRKVTFSETGTWYSIGGCPRDSDPVCVGRARVAVSSSRAPSFFCRVILEEIALSLRKRQQHRESWVGWLQRPRCSRKETSLNNPHGAASSLFVAGPQLQQAPRLCPPTPLCCSEQGSVTCVHSTLSATSIFFNSEVSLHAPHRTNCRDTKINKRRTQ